MQPNELKALLAKTDEVAIEPVHVEIEVYQQRSSRRRRQIYCPTGLIKAKVIQDGYKWIEKRTLSVCGDQAYDITRRNGVLVEIDPDDLSTTAQLDHLYFPIKATRDKKIIVGKNKYAYPHAEMIERDGKQYIRLITSRKAVFASWGEYALEIAKEEQEQKREEEERMKLRRPQAALMGMTYEEFEETHMVRKKNVPKRIDEAKPVYLGAEWYAPYVYDRNGDYKRDKTGKAIRGKPVGKIDITIDRANEILEILTPEQKAALGIPTEKETHDPA